MKPPNEEHTVSESTNHVYPKAAAGEQSANVAPNPSFPKLEESVLDYWDKDNTFQKSIDRRPSGDHSQNEFVFFDGPPFANGLPHYGHLLTGYAKDVIPRYQTMKGHKVNRVFGWDTHGLPAELEAQKELGIDSVDQVKEMGIDKFNDACRASVLKYTNEWKAYVHRQARWVDFEHGYKTLNITYMESVMWAFKQLYDKGLAYQGYRVLPYCPKDQTPLSAHELRMDADVYQDRQDTTVSVAVKLRDEEDAYAVFWTTTPWTVPTNFAIVVGADIDYVEVRPTEGKFAGKKFYLGKPLLGSYEKELGENYEIVRELKGAEMEGWRYYPVFPYFAGDENAAEGKVPGPEGYQIFTADYVDTVEGTGLVHQAPYGEDDMNTLNAKGIKSVDVLDAGCKFTSLCPDYEGMYVFDANKPILRNLRAGDGPLARIPEEQRAILFQEKSYVHSYPHCWRCATPLIYKPVSSWFVAVTKIKDRLLELNQQINWIPNNVKDGQFGKWLANARDWSISRNRFWGSPIPVWVSDDPKYPRVDVYGSLDELKADFGDYPRDHGGQHQHAPPVHRRADPRQPGRSDRQEPHAPHQRRDGLLVRIRFDELRPVPLSVRKQGNLRTALPVRLHRGIHRPDPWLVLRAARHGHRPVRQAGVQERDLPRHSARLRRTEDVEASAQLSGRERRVQRLRLRRHALVPHELADPARRQPYRHRRWHPRHRPPGHAAGVEFLLLLHAVRERGRVRRPYAACRRSGEAAGNGPLPAGPSAPPGRTDPALAG